MFSDAKIVRQGDNYYAVHGDDSGLYVEFSIEPVKNERRSTEEGRPIFEEKEYITIRIAGDTKTVRKRPVKHTWDGGTPPDPERWPRQYQAFKNQQSQEAVDGTPLHEWAMISKTDVMSLKALNIHSVEQLASLGENNMQWFGARQMRDKAIAWLESAKAGAGVSQLQQRLEQLEADNLALKSQLAALGEEKPRRGRPPKDMNDAENAP